MTIWAASFHFRYLNCCLCVSCNYGFNWLLILTYIFFLFRFCCSTANKSLRPKTKSEELIFNYPSPNKIYLHLILKSPIFIGSTISSPIHKKEWGSFTVILTKFETSCLEIRNCIPILSLHSEQYDTTAQRWSQPFPGLNLSWTCYLTPKLNNPLFISQTLSHIQCMKTMSSKLLEPSSFQENYNLRLCN